MPLAAADLIRLIPLLDQALQMDAAGRQTWLDALAADHQDLLPVLPNTLFTEAASVALESAALWSG
jgi:hypothetical protein